MPYQAGAGPILRDPGLSDRGDPRRVESDGPSLILVLFGVALLIGILVGLGARSLTSPDTDRGPEEGRLSAMAAHLGYHTEWDYAGDRKREAAALRQVLGAPPGAQHLWENVESGNRGVIWAAPEVPRADGGACRSLDRRTLVNGAFRSAQGKACRNARGVWDDAVQWRGG